MAVLHNGPMPPRVVGSRIEAKEITDLAHLSRDSEIRPRVLILLIIGFIDLEVAQFLKNDVLLVVAVSFIVAIFLVMRVNFVRMRWVFTEMFGARNLSYRVSPDKEEGKPADEQPVKSRNIRIRNLICTLEQHREMVEFADNNSEQWPEVDLSRWYRPVLVTHVESDIVKLGILGREDPVWVELDERRYFRRARPLAAVPSSWNDDRRSAEVAKAMTDLLDFLSEDQEHEDIVVERLISEYRDSDWSVRNALLVADSAKLIEWKRRIPSMVKALLVVAQAFLPLRLRTGLGGHASCKIKLTALGSFWRESESHPAEAEAEFERSDQGGTVMNIYSGDHNEVHGSATSVGRENIVLGNVIDQRMRDAENLDIHALAEELRELSSYLIAQANDRAQFLAIRQIESAIDAAEKQDKRASLEHLSKLGKLSGWVMDAGKAIGVGVAVAAINVALGNSHP